MNAAAAALVVLNGRQAFDPRASLFAHNEPGFWYDPSDLSSMFQDSAGTTPVTAVEQAVGLVLDKSRGLVLGGDLVTNGTFNTDTTGWTAVNSPTLSVGANGVTIQNNGATSGILYQAMTCVAGRAYQVSVKITYGGTGFARCETSTIIPASVGGTVINASASGTYSFVFVASATTMYIVIGNRNDNNASHTYDNISVRELTGNHAIQPTAANRPILRARYNLALQSETLTNAAWTVTRATVAAASGVGLPPNVAAAFKVTEDSTASNTHLILLTNDVVVASGGGYRTQIRAKAGERTWVALQEGQGVTATAYFNLATGAVGTVSGTGSPTASISALGDGWYLCTLNWSASGTAARIRAFLATGDGTASYTGDGTSGLYITGADLRANADTYLPYQRIAAATDYDTVGFPVYLAFDGSDDSLYTGGNLDLSGTDKLTVFAGVTKLSDGSAGTYGCIAELGTDINSVNGTWAVFGPAAAPGGTPDFGMSSRGTLTANAIASSNAAPITRVMTGEGQIGGLPFVTLRLDGTQAASGVNSQGTGNYGSYPLYIGRRNNASLPFNGRLYSLIGRGAATSAALITQAERWVAGKQGRSL